MFLKVMQFDRLSARHAGLSRLVLRAALCVAFGFANPAVAQERAIALPQLKSGLAFAGDDVRKLQADDFQNPAMLWVDKGKVLWNKPDGPRNAACASCHQEAAQTMKGVSARYPKFDHAIGKVTNVEGKINHCRQARQGLPAWALNSDELQSMHAYVALQSRGVPTQVAIDGPAKPVFEQGQNLFNTRMGQLNLACTHCHDARYGLRLGAETISQGQPNAYPIYRLEWQGMGSVQRRLRSCLSGVRAQLWPLGAEELLALELFLAWRGEGLPVESPGVRR
jgi:L-cysteine S-thiosulfotransferase